MGLGAALVVFLAGVTAAVAAGQSPPTALWAAGGAISGGLLGLLVPTPGTQAAHAKTAAALTAVADTMDARAVAAANPADAAAARAAATEVTAEAAGHSVAAAETGVAARTLVFLALFFVLLLALAIVLAGGAITPPTSFVESLKGITTAIVALASAAGTAIIGILAPSPAKGG